METSPRTPGFGPIYAGDHLVECFGAVGFDEILFILKIKIDGGSGVFGLVRDLAERERFVAIGDDELCRGIDDFPTQQLLFAGSALLDSPSDPKFLVPARRCQTD